ncbi:transposase [Xanthomonas citri pv. malvacearum]|nr:transposase [Xanthomonas citri pv. malvacearum]ASN08603.1 transposase [Xanthomonas citri pv. malvacearum]EKQ62087.1 IS1595 transposase [Xanthomonas citri pv. malvacearum str. GSPB2388]OOW78220.1 transposase [Xanthomonas campestris pv. leeana]OOW94514.1 transposase [Xanthomonas citri pv. malvacearum]
MAVQTDATFPAPRCVVIEPVRSFDNISLQDWIARRLVPECKVHTDPMTSRTLDEHAWREPVATPLSRSRANASQMRLPQRITGMSN